MVPNIQWMKQNFDFFNKKYFGGQLRAPRFSVNNCPEDLWGCYDSATNTLSLTQLYSRNEHSVQETMIHEMIHMFIITVKGINPWFEHGPMFYSIANKINADGWNISAITNMTDDDVLYRGEKIPDEADNPGQNGGNVGGNKGGLFTNNAVSNMPNEVFAQRIQEMFNELQRIYWEVEDIKTNMGLNESKRIIISEEQERYLISMLNEEKTGKKMYFIDPNKVLLLKKHLDNEFIPLDYEMMKGGKADCIKIAGRLTPKTKQVIEQLYEEDLDDWAADKCKDMFLDDDECEKFAKLVVNRWLNNNIGVHGMLDVNYFY